MKHPAMGILLKCRLRGLLAKLPTQSVALQECHHSTSPFQLARLFFLGGTNSDVRAGELLRNFMTLERTPRNPRDVLKSSFGDRRGLYWRFRCAMSPICRAVNCRCRDTTNSYYLELHHN